MEKTTWIFPANKNVYDAVSAFNTLVKVDWHQTKAINNINVNDLVYIYMSSPIQAVVFKCIVNKTNITKLEIEDAEFYVDKTAYTTVGPFVEIQAFQEFDTLEGLKYSELKKHGLQGSLRSPMKVTGELLKHLEKCDEEQRLLDRLGGGNIKLMTEMYNRKNIINKTISIDMAETEEEQEKQSKELSDDILEEFAKKQETLKPIVKQVTVNQIKRSSYIAEMAKRRANGICQLCNQPAPFCRSDGEPYLESHHIIWLSNGGSDTLNNTVALCPNCHKKMHIVADVKDIQLLKNKQSKE